jgi:hypothetical protein
VEESKLISVSEKKEKKDEKPKICKELKDL